MPQQDTHSNAGASRGFKILLAVSLAFNFAIVGLVAGAALRSDGEKNRPFRSAGLGSYGTPYMMALSREDRRKILGNIRSETQTQLPSRTMRQDMFRAVIDSLRATPFDPDALAIAVYEQAQVSISVQQQAQTAWLAHVASMSDSERSVYADKVEETMVKSFKRRWRDRKKN